MLTPTAAHQHLPGGLCFNVNFCRRISRADDASPASPVAIRPSLRGRRRSEEPAGRRSPRPGPTLLQERALRWWRFARRRETGAQRCHAKRALTMPRNARVAGRYKAHKIEQPGQTPDRGRPGRPVRLLFLGLRRAVRSCGRALASTLPGLAEPVGERRQLFLPVNDNYFCRSRPRPSPRPSAPISTIAFG